MNTGYAMETHKFGDAKCLPFDSQNKSSLAKQIVRTKVMFSAV